MTEREQKFMHAAIELSLQGMRENKGGPFGAIVVKDNQIIGWGYNRVATDLDPTAHAEVVAIRDACRNLNSFQLDGCEIYTSCEPCPMCLGAIYWARPAKVYFGNTRKDAADIGFDDSMIYDEIITEMARRRIPMVQIARDQAWKAFKEWQNKSDKRVY